MKEESKNIALYRKYRPGNFSEVVGQDHIVKAISGALEAGKVSHAYLLCGPRGIGKTTIARIISKELGSSQNDTYEIDAASNRGIEEVRNITENVYTLPFDSKYKIYILDEVHMFTSPAWNALLKTIEEPPNHVIFILATTELEKIPETIVSRCQTFIFRKPTENILAHVVSSVANKEGYKLESGVPELIALLADGAFRDALGILHKVISFSKDKNIKQEEVESITGAPNSLLVNDFLLALAEGEIEKGYLCIGQVTKQNIDMSIYLKMILAKLRYALMLRYAPLTIKEIKENISEKDLEFIEKLIEKKPEYVSSRTLSVLLEAYQSLRTAVISQIPLELALNKIFTKD